MENCKVSAYLNSTVLCEKCKDDYYLSLKDNRCHNNTDKESPFYKCAKSDPNETVCHECLFNYYPGNEDNKCSPVMNCAISDGDKCIKCVEDSCLNIKDWTCEDNNYIEDESKQIFYKCLKTNKKATACETCMDNYTLTEDGYCIDEIHCIEKNDNGECIKCQEADELGDGYCLNKIYGCAESFISEGCIRCDDFLNFDDCTKCAEGYKLVESRFWSGEHLCEIEEED